MPSKYNVILFYKYAPLSNDEALMKLYQSAITNLCNSLSLTGRILIGVSTFAEGINGTLSGTPKINVEAFTYALLGPDWCHRHGVLSWGKTMSSTISCATTTTTTTNDRMGVRVIDGAKVTLSTTVKEAIETFWNESDEFSNKAGIPMLTIDSPEDFKWSCEESNSDDDNNDLFPDLNIKLVKEIINTGGKLSTINVSDTSKGYLTPEEWHEEMRRLTNNNSSPSSTALSADDGTMTTTSNNDAILIDCRNHKEYEIGHFSNAVNPNTKTYSQFPKWVQDNKSTLRGRKIFMYCTGGVRCEKASALIRNEVGADDSSENKTSVYHLKGGIHKYIDKFGSDGFFRGKNFVFDRRIATEAKKSTTSSSTNDDGGNVSMDIDSIPSVASHEFPRSALDSVSLMTADSSNIVGQCLYCQKHYDEFSPATVCTVCRELVLVCNDCSPKLRGEYHCVDHQHLKDCYFTNLSLFSKEQLKIQLKGLEEQYQIIAVGKRYKQRRRTLHRQCDRIQKELEEREAEGSNDNILSRDLGDEPHRCRSCGAIGCNGTCWGTYGLRRKERLEVDKEEKLASDAIISSSKLLQQSIGRNPSKRISKQNQKERDIAEIKKFSLSLPPSSHRDASTSLRCPPPFIRSLHTSAKGRWCGNAVIDVLQTEFFDLSDPTRLELLLDKRLIRVNGVPVNGNDALNRGTNDKKAISPDTKLKNMDIVSRIVYWIEPPVIVPERISVTRYQLPQSVMQEYFPQQSSEDTNIYCCNKPSSVPVHAGGCYLSNSLTLMVEGQEQLEPKSLLPCHRLDRCTSGLVLCCTSPSVAHIFQSQMNLGTISKVYVARVRGRFPISMEEAKQAQKSKFSNTAESDPSRSLHNDTTWRWSHEKSCLEINAPIETFDAQMPVRKVTSQGKESQSWFKYLTYDETKDISIILCRPISGRTHQLRVHLEFIGYPIHNDCQYGGILSSSTGKILKEQAIKAISNISQNTTESLLEEALVGNDDQHPISEECMNAAKEVCLCSQGTDGIEKAFNDAQLLNGGHAIDLHAYQYRVNFQSKPAKRSRKKKKTYPDTETTIETTVVKTTTLAEMVFKVEKPEWARNYDEVFQCPSNSAFIGDVTN